MKTIWKYDGKYKADPGKAYTEINSLDVITPQAVVDLARDENSVIHNDYEWDNEIAGEKYRIHQAQEMLRSFVLIKEPELKRSDPVELKLDDDYKSGNNEPVSGYNYGHRAFQNTSQRNVYAPNEFFVENRNEYEILLEKALNELKAFRRRYSMIAELEEVFVAVDNL